MAVEALEAERERWVEEGEQWERRGQVSNPKCSPNPGTFPEC
jgi:hypothetical protein